MIRNYIILCLLSLVVAGCTAKLTAEKIDTAVSVDRPTVTTSPSTSAPVTSEGGVNNVETV